MTQPVYKQYRELLLRKSINVKKKSDTTKNVAYKTSFNELSAAVQFLYEDSDHFQMENVPERTMGDLKASHFLKRKTVPLGDGAFSRMPCWPQWVRKTHCRTVQ